MRFFTLLFLALCFLVAESTAQSSFKKHSVGFNFSNDVTSQFDKYQLSDSQNRAVKYGYSAALLYQYRPATWFSLETGVEINSTAHQIDDSNPPIFWQEWPDGRSYFNRLNRIGIPINLRWHCQRKRWDFYALTGIVLTTSYSGASNLFNDGDLERVKVKFKERSFEDGFAIAISTGIGTAYQLTQNWSLSVEPRFRVYDVIDPTRSEFADGTYSGEMPWAVGLNLGVYYGFGKN